MGIYKKPSDVIVPVRLYPHQYQNPITRRTMVKASIGLAASAMLPFSVGCSGWSSNDSGKTDNNNVSAGGGLTPQSKEAEKLTNLIHIDERYTWQERREAMQAVDGFLQAFKAQDFDTIATMCPTDGNYYNLISFADFFKYCSQDTANAIVNGLLGFNYTVDDVHIEGNQLDYKGQYRVRVSIATYDIGSVELSAMNEGVKQFLLSSLGVAVDTFIFDRYDHQGIVSKLLEGFELGQGLVDDYYRTYYDAIAIGIATQIEPTIVSNIYFYAIVADDGWKVVPTCDKDLVQIYGNWSPIRTCRTHFDEETVQTAMNDLNSTVDQRNYEQIAKGQNSDENEVYLSDVMLWRVVTNSLAQFYRISATVENRSDSKKDVLINLGFIVDGEKKYSTSCGSFTPGCIDDGDIITSYILSDDGGASAGNEDFPAYLAQTLASAGYILCPSLAPGEKRDILVGVERSELVFVQPNSLLPYAEIHIARDLAEWNGQAQQAYDIQVKTLDGDLTMTFNKVGYGRPETHKAKVYETFIVNGNITNNTDNTVRIGQIFFASYDENGNQALPVSGLVNYGTGSIQNDLAPGESGMFEVYGDDPEWLIDSVCLDSYSYSIVK